MKKLKKFLALFLALVMLLGMVCTTALAVDETTTPETTQAETPSANENAEQDDSKTEDGNIESGNTEDGNTEDGNTEEQNEKKDNDVEEESATGSVDEGINAIVEDGGESENAKCTCDTKCGETGKTDCPVCSADGVVLAEVCTGKTAVERFKATVEDLYAMDYVSSVDAAVKEAIKAADEIFDTLTDEEKTQVTAANERLETLRKVVAEPLEGEVTGPQFLSKAVGGVITLTGDVTLTSTIRLDGKTLTIDGNGFTVTRSENFAAYCDNYQSWHSGPMIEVANGSKLTLRNVTFDEQGRCSGTNYSQTVHGENNMVRVQGGMIEAYTSTPSNDVTLEEGAVLANYGGMSAVRLSAGNLYMKSGSKIVGSKNFTTKGGGNGAAGAVWIQGGTMVADSGSFIGSDDSHTMYGRAVYVDSGEATINGTISNIAPNGNMWFAGEVGIHVRNGAQVTLGSKGLIDGKHLSATAVKVDGGSFTMDDGSVIKNMKTGISTGAGTVYANGEITGMNGGNAVNIQGADVTIGPKAYLHHNKVWYGAI